ncbi:DUF882 domain-containing protein [Dongia deserti]|uniref:DUF882 domain-containing protein n=1 Tax=Dongia deserti TaxID=2268030 RepID=UPI000E64B087|nr:DUF882 domain-containing protein [Dongia deserti]
MTDHTLIPDSEDSTLSKALVGRRRVLAFGLGTAALVIASPLKGALAALPQSGTRTLGLVSTHTNEKIMATYWRDGVYDKGALKDINYVLRDFRTGDVAVMDPQLLDLLVELHRRTGSRKAFQVISGYRSPKTNAMLASGSGGVAKRSLHMEAKAIDIRLYDVALSDLRQTAIAMKAGGVGYYKKSDFVHVDTGRVRQW